MGFRGFAALLSVAMASLVCSASASADTTIGELAPMQNPPAICAYGPYDEVPAGQTSVHLYTVPFEGTITSWSTKAAAGEGQQLVFKVFRPVGESNTKYTVLAHDGPRALAPSTVNTFAVSISVKAGDVIGFNDTASVLTRNTACVFETGSWGDFDISQEGEAQDGEILEGVPPNLFESGLRPNISAVVVPPLTPTPVIPTPCRQCRLTKPIAGRHADGIDGLRALRPRGAEIFEI